MKKILMSLFLVMTLAFTLGSAFAVETFRTPTELLYYDQAKAQNGYIFFWPIKEKNVSTYTDRVGTLWLIDMQGNVVHTWPGIENNPMLYPDGLVINNDQDPSKPSMATMDWSGKKTKLFPTIDMGDTRRIWNNKLKEYTYIGTTEFDITKDEIVAVGGDPALSYTGATCDGIVEYDQRGTLVWKWRFIDHVIQDRSASRPNYVGTGKTIKDYPGKLNLYFMNDNGVLRNVEGPYADWQHCNSMDYHEDLDYVVINSKHWSEFYVINHGATFVKGDPAASFKLAASDQGDFIYRFGKPSAYGQGVAPGFNTEGQQQMYGAHNIQWIKPYAWPKPHPEAGDKWPDPATIQGTALPGAGNFLIFDNGIYNPRLASSRILEINPYISGIDKATGKPTVSNMYVNPPDAGFTSAGRSNQIVWTYKSKLPNSFFSQSQSGMHRLPNGNTHINSANTGHMFQVTPAGEVVWEYINPVDAFKGPVTVQTEGTGNGREHDVFRSYWFPLNHPAFTGKDMTPKGKISGMGESGIQYLQDKLNRLIY